MEDHWLSAAKKLQAIASTGLSFCQDQYDRERYAEVGEIAEEANLQVKARLLYAVRHKAKHAYDEDVRDFYKLFFLCEQVDEALPVAGSECLDAGFFNKDALPDLSLGRVIRDDIVAAYEYLADPRRAVSFD